MMISVYVRVWLLVDLVHVYNYIMLGELIINDYIQFEGESDEP